MTEPANGPALPSNFDDIIFGPNPYLKNDSMHEAWAIFVDLMRHLTEGNERLAAELPLDAHAKEPDFHQLILDIFTGRFDVFAKTLISRVDGYEIARAFNELLDLLREASVRCLKQATIPPSVDRSRLALDLELRLVQRSAHWRAEALSTARKAEGESCPRRVRGERTEPISSPNPTGKVGGPKLATWLRTQMETQGHMTVNRLHVLTDLDRKTIKAMLEGHVVLQVRLRKLAAGLGVPYQEIPTN